MINKENIEDSESVPGAGTTLWKFAGAEFDELKWELRVAGVVAELEPRPLEILLCLLRHAGETVTKDELLQSIWGHAYLSENALSNAIGKLRKALRDESQSIIVTTYKVGYRLAVPVVRRESIARPKARLGLKPGDTVPGRPDWRLTRELGVTSGSEVWLAAPAGDDPDLQSPRVFKFSPDGQRLSSLKREAALSRLVRETLGDREELVKVLDWGFDAPPFFIECEYGGQSLPEWLDRHGGAGAQPMALRLDLLAQVAEAVALIHSVGVLHKDLKPANILIDEGEGGAPRVRLTDFGNGTLLDPGRLAEWGLTRMNTQSPAHAVSGTPLYLAPELLLGHSPTVQSDLYALGVILYQLAVGDLRRPLAAGWEREIGDELLRQDIADSANGDPEHRLTSARDLAERLRHLGQRRHQLSLQRQQQAAALAAQRMLERSHARRPWLIAAGMALGAGLLTSLIFFRQAPQSRDQERDEAAMVRAVNGFLDNDLLAAANPNVGGSMDVSVRDAIAKASSRIDVRFAKSPALSVALHQTVGSAYRTLGQYSDAEREFRSARMTAYSSFGPGAGLSQTSDLLLAQDLAYQNKYDEALSLLAPIDSLMWRQPDLDPMIQVRLWDVHMLLDGHHSNLLAAAADADQTQAALDRMRLRYAAVYAANSDFIYLVSLHVAHAYDQAGQSAKAEQIERPMVVQLGTERGAGDPLTIQAREKWLMSLIDLGRVGDAENYLPALEHDVRTLGGEESPLSLEFVKVQAMAAAARQHWSDAIRYRGVVESGYGRLFGVNNDASILAMLDTAMTLRAAGQFGLAVDKYLEAYGLAQARMGSSALLTQKIAYGLTAACLDDGKPEQAELYLKALNPAALAAASPGRDWNARVAYQRGRYALQGGHDAEAQREFAYARKLVSNGSDPAFLSRLQAVAH